MDISFLSNHTSKRVLLNTLSIFVILTLTFPVTGSVYAQESTVAPTLAGTNILVNTSEDELNADGDCSLREAIQAANTDTAVDACTVGVGADVIDLPAGVYYLSINGPNEDGNLSGDLDIVSDLTINGSGTDTTQIDGANLDRVFHIIDGNVNISAVTVQHGFVMGALEGGGGIMNHANLVLTDSVVAGNMAAASMGGGIFNYEVATATLSNTTVSENTSGFMGGGIYNVGSFTFRSGTVIGNTASYGSGIGNEGNLELSASTIANNTDSSAGGGILNNGGFLSLHAGTATLTNVTMSGNSATFGAGIRNLGNIEIYSSTISSNTGPYGAGFYSDNAIQMKNSILADNTLDCVGILASVGHNLVEDTSLCTITGDTSSMITGLDPMLDPLQDNGGPTQTHALLPNSPAIDAGNPAGCTDSDENPLAVDQRGEPRPVDGNSDGTAICDIGAYEAGEVPPPSISWRDEFNDTPGAPWYWVNENPEKWSINDGFLRIYASAYGTGSENLLLREVANGDFAIETRVFFEPDTNFQIAGLVIWQDGLNFLQLGRAFCDIEGPCVGNGIYFDKIVNGSGVESNFATQMDNPFNPAEAYLRLERRGEMVRAFYSHEGITWTEIGTHWIPADFQVNAVGVMASQDFNTPDLDISADFDYFELTEGWGFLPEGFHDYDGGDVPDWACNAGGWAADPDDRATDLAVEINIDGTSLPDWLYASEYREDLDTAGVCVDGNCSFSTSLWGTISAYEPHSVVVYAQDVPSGEWVQLSNSPKDITCRSYDIYAYDPLTGTTKLVTTNLPDTGEYDPTWSPNGKKVAHDVVTGDGHGIYVTDLKTGVSTPLIGADDGGNDASWSPNGKWIAFDRRWYGEPHIFIVPATGGQRILVRENAVNANWAPNGKRIVFQDDTDGSIRTVPVDGGVGGETLIADYGGLPAWSPDGNWIAYSRDGDIWKVQVNVQGRVLGEPVQLTSNPFNDGKPTWSPDSQTITYDSGFGQDHDLWSIPAAGGMPTWLTGAPVFGDYSAAYARNSSTVAYASFSPDGQAIRSWVSAFTYGLPDGYWTEGTHSYHFETAGSDNTDELSFSVDPYARLYDGTVLLRPWSVIGRTGESCNFIDTINPAEQTQFYVGWGMEGSYSDALAYYQNLAAKVAWDGGSPVDLVQHEIFPYTAPLDWMGYVCTYTAGLPAMDLRVNYGDNWVESFYEAGHNVHLTVTESDGVTVKATADVVTEPKDYWDGGTGFQTNDSLWYDAEGNPIDGQPDIRPYDWVFASVDNGVTAQVQIGEIRGVLDVITDSVQGTVLVPWFSNELNLECWGGPANSRSDSVLPDGTDPYVCSWVGEWDIPYTDAVGVGYIGPDGHWVANIFRNPHIHIYPEQDFVDADEWAEGVQVNAWVDGKPQCTAEGIPTYPPGNPWTTAVSMPFPDDCDLVPGDLVYASNGITTVSHTIRNLAITDVNQVENTVTGTADNGELVYAWVHGYGETEEHLLVTDGTWVSHFNGFDLVEGMCGRSEIRDEVGNTTGVDWCVPNPNIIAHPDQEWVEGWGFEEGAEIWLTIYDDNDVQLYQGSAIAALPDWDPNNPNAFVRFDVDYDLKFGDHLWMTDGISTKDMIVTQLMPTGVDPGGQIVHGVAAGNSEVTLEHQGEMWVVMADPDGNWSATLPTIARGSDVLASQWDDDGDMTRIAFHIPNTRFTVWPEQNYLEGYEWPDGALVSISVAGKAACSTDAVSGFPEWDQSNTFFSLSFPEGCTIGVGDFITLSYEPLSLTHQVQELAIGHVDLDADTVSGTAIFDPEQYILHTWIHGVDQSYMQLSPEDGNWSADFGSKGFNLQPGMGGRVELVDQSSNATAVEWYVPNPHFTVFPLWEWYDAMDWPTGTTVAITVEGKPDCNLQKESPGNFFNGGFPAGCDIAAGDTITFTNGETSRTHVVRNLAVTAIDLGEDTISGTADSGTTVYVWPHDGGFEPLQAVANDSNGWQVDLGDAGYDIQEGASGRSEIRDEMGNATAVDWNLNPRLIVHTQDDWFRAEGFMPNTPLTFRIYDTEGGSLLLASTTPQTDGGGTVTHWVGDQMDVVPGNYIVVSDGTSTRNIVLEALTFDVFDTTQGILHGTAPAPLGRTVSYGIGCWQRDDLTGDVTTNEDGAWIVDFGSPVPNDFGCVFAWIYDDDGDSSEARPEQIIWWDE